MLNSTSRCAIVVIGLMATAAAAGPIIDGSGPAGTDPLPANATLRPEGPPVAGSNVWIQSWTAQLPTSFDLIAVSVTQGNFSDPALENFASNDWSESYRNAAHTTAAATGSFSSSIAFDTQFAAAMSLPLTVDFAFFLGNESTFKSRHHWDGQTWTTSTTSWNPDRLDFVEAIPLPSAGLTGLAGLLGLAALRRRRGV